MQKLMFDWLGNQFQDYVASQIDLLVTNTQSLSALMPLYTSTDSVYTTATQYSSLLRIIAAATSQW